MWKQWLVAAGLSGALCCAVTAQEGVSRDWKLLTQTLSNKVQLYTRLTKSECDAKRHELVAGHQGVTYDDYVIVVAECFQ